MHAAGWVHRDVSTGNILLENHTARLADMEYAKKAGQGDECRLVCDFTSHEHHDVYGWLSRELVRSLQ